MTMTPRPRSGRFAALDMRTLAVRLTLAVLRGDDSAGHAALQDMLAYDPWSIVPEFALLAADFARYASGDNRARAEQLLEKMLQKLNAAVASLEKLDGQAG